MIEVVRTKLTFFKPII